MMNEKEYLDQRVNDQIKWHSEKSQANKVRYKTMRTAVIGLSVLIPFLAVLITDDQPILKYITGGIGLIIAFLEGMLVLNKHQDKWMDYRATAETLKREKFLFATRTGKYKEREEAFSIFVESVEDMLAKENSNWMDYVKVDNENDGESEDN